MSADDLDLTALRGLDPATVLALCDAAEAVERVRQLCEKAEAGEGVVIYPGHSVFYNVDTGLLRQVIGDLP